MFKLNNIFYSIQGEGYWVGTPMWFVRFAGCNLKCWFCDTDHSLKYELATEEIVAKIPSGSRVCLTGGEPLLQPIQELVNGLLHKECSIHIETNGSLPIHPYLPQAWVSCSPKEWNPEVWEGVHEVKYLVGERKELWKQALDHSPLALHKFLQPVWGKSYERNLKEAVRLVKQNPMFRLGLQMHKHLQIE